MQTLPNLPNNRRRYQKSTNSDHDGPVCESKNGPLSIHSKHGIDGAFYGSIKFSVVLTKAFFCTDWMAIHYVYTDNTRSIEKSNATEAWLWYGVILQDAIILWRHGEDSQHLFFLTVCLNWYSRNEFECKFELNCDFFWGRNSCVCVMSLTTLPCITLHWNWRFVCVNKITRIAVSTNILNTPNSDSIVQNSLACCFSHENWFSGRCDVIRT